MKNVLKLIVTAAIATTLAGAVMAQQAGPTNGGLTNGQGQNPGKDGAKRGGAMKIGKEVLAKVQPALNDEQKKQISDLDKKTMESMKSLREKAKGGDKTQLRNDLKKITTDYRESLLKILTPAQQESFKNLYKEAVAKNRKDGKGGKKGGLNKGGN